MSSSLVENAAKDMQARGEHVTATTETGWKWWRASQASHLVRLVRIALRWPAGLRLQCIKLWDVGIPGTGRCCGPPV